MTFFHSNRVPSPRPPSSFTSSLFSFFRGPASSSAFPNLFLIHFLFFRFSDILPLHLGLVTFLLLFHLLFLPPPLPILPLFLPPSPPLHFGPCVSLSFSPSPLSSPPPTLLILCLSLALSSTLLTTAFLPSSGYQQN